MFFPTLTTFTAVLLALSGTTQAIGGNAHALGHGNRPRRAQHFGRQALDQPQPPAGAKVYTTHIAKPEGYPNGNSSHVEVDGEMVRRGEGVVDLEARGGPVGKRAFSGMRATYYAIGLGACGQYDSEPAYIVALNSAQYGGGYPGPQCFKSITITGGSRNGHAVATIKDECPTCPYGGLDMSEALFSNFASADEGVATITWWFNDEAPPAPAPTTSSTPAWTPAPEPTTSSTPAYTPPPSTSTTPAYTPPTTSWTPPPTTSSVWTPPAETSTSSSYVAPPPSSSSSSATPTPSSSSSTPAPSSSSSSSSPSSAVSSSAVSSSRASTATFSMSSLALGKAAASSTAATGTRTNTAASASATETTSGVENYTGATGNLEMLSDVTLQLGNMVVMSAQQAQ